MHPRDGFKDVEVQPFAPGRAIVPLGISVLLGLARLGVGLGEANDVTADADQLRKSRRWATDH